MKIAVLILFALSIILLSCSDNCTTCSDSDDEVEVQIDLQSGFQDESVSIKIDNKQYFSSTLPEYEPLAGPKARFIVFLSRGNHNLITRRFQVFNIANLHTDTTEINIGDAEKYWVGMQENADSLYIVVQDSSFLYL